MPRHNLAIESYYLEKLKILIEINFKEKKDTIIS